MGTIKKLKKELIAIGVFYLVLCIEIVGAFCVTKSALKIEDSIINHFGEFTSTMGSYMKNPFKIIMGLFKEKVFENFFTGCFYLLVVFICLTIWFLIKNKNKHEYEGIENGSSEWSKGGEEYSVLNKKEGFILSKNHYLGTDLKKVKINKNILVIGRIWCW